MEYEFSFSAEDFTRVQRLIYRLAGIVLADGKRGFDYSRAIMAVHASRLPSRRISTSWGSALFIYG
jgi:hypothetical protein